MAACFHRHDVPNDVAVPRLTLVTTRSGRTDCYLGIDIGSISTKGVIIDADRRIIARTYLWTEGNPADAARRDPPASPGRPPRGAR
ncbi:hypothetical protein NE553_15640, partial [Eggerthella lenta]|nr:hypothetical protein [Eggerthella lenta]